MKKHTLMTFAKLFFPFVLILITVSVLGSRSYKKAVNMMIAESVQTQSYMLDSTKQIVDRTIKDVQNMTVEFSLNQKYRNHLLSVSKPSSPFSAYLEAGKVFNEANLNRSFMYEYALYFENTDFLILSHSISLRPEYDYLSAIQYNGMDFHRWVDFLKENTSREGTFIPVAEMGRDGQKKNVISYVRMLPFDFPEPTGVIQVFIDDDYFQNTLSEYIPDNHGALFILDGKGNIITHRGDVSYSSDCKKGMSSENSRSILYLEPEKGEEWGRYLVSVKSDKLDWTYVSILPEQVVLGKVNAVRHEIIWVSVAILLSIAILGLAAVLYNLKSVRQILRKVQGFGNGSQRSLNDDFSLIRQNLDSLLQSHDRLATTFQKQVPRVIHSIVQDVIVGRVRNVDDIAATLEETGIEIRRDHYCVAIFKITYLYNENLQKLIVEETVKRLGGNNCLTTNYSMDRVAVLMLGDGDVDAFSKTCRTFLRECADAVLEKKIDCFCVMGPVCHQLETIQKSTRAAAGMAENILAESGENVFYYEDYRKTMTGSYIAQDEQRFLNLIRQGDVVQTGNLLDQVLEKRTEELKQSTLKTKDFYIQLCAILKKVMDDTTEYTSLVEKIRQCDFEKEIEGMVRQAFMETAEIWNGKQVNRNADIVSEIQEYIRENYQDSSMCLADIADKYRISEAYFSQIFKNITGENFSVYLENTRMEQAKILLKDSLLTVEEIAGKVGYNSINTFHKAFKRVNGVTPGAYKTAVIKQKNRENSPK